MPECCFCRRDGSSGDDIYIQQTSSINPQSHLSALLPKLGQTLMLFSQVQIPTSGHSLNLTRSHTT